MLKSQDILILLKISLNINKADLHQFNLAYELGLSQAEVSLSLRRSIKADLFEPEQRKVNKSNLLELLNHGIRYFFPPEIGPETRGIPTAWSAPPLNGSIIVSEGQSIVWPDANGTFSGAGLEPLYKTVPQAAIRDSNLYQALALIDGIRAGRARERALSIDLLKQLLFSKRSNGDKND